MSETTEQLRPAGFGGVLLRPGDPAYDEARMVFNAMIDKRPAVIAQCESAARRRGGGPVRRTSRGWRSRSAAAGHGVAGTGVTDGGLVIDLRKMRQCPARPGRQARPGRRRCDLGRFRSGLLAVRCWRRPAAGSRPPGVAGLTLGGGSGWLERKFGLACDSLVSVELITADGELVIADETKNSELFWALHGGGGNFGVATSLTLQPAAAALDDAGHAVLAGATPVPRCSARTGICSSKARRRSWAAA